MDAGLRVGQEISVKGFFTRALHLRGAGSELLERLLGYSHGRLGDGWWLLFMLGRPAPHEFEFRGYSHMSGGVYQGHLSFPPDRRTAESHLVAGGYDVARLKAEAAAGFALSGPHRLAKILPKRSGGEYPPGSGIPQWELVVPKRFRVAADVAPGATYMGSYD